jgi:hypothetical protein
LLSFLKLNFSIRNSGVVIYLWKFNHKHLQPTGNANITVSSTVFIYYLIRHDLLNCVFPLYNQVYKVCLKSNATCGIKDFINNWTKNQHHSLQSSSLEKPHTARDIVFTLGSSAGSLHVEVPSAGLSQPFGCCPQFQNDDF